MTLSSSTVTLSSMRNIIDVVFAYAIQTWKNENHSKSIFLSLIMLFALVTHKATATARYEFLTENGIYKGILQQRLVPYVPDYHERLNYKLKFLLSVRNRLEQKQCHEIETQTT